MPGVAVIGPHDLATTWPWDPASIIALGLAAAAWVAAGRHHPARHAGLWWAGLAVLAVALLSPLDAVSEQLMSFHMVQHLLIGLVAPLLLVRARPGRTLGVLLHPQVRRDWSRAMARLLRSRWLAPAVVLGHVALWWAWHVPALWDLAVRHDLVHAAEHATLFASGLALWTITWPAGPVRRRGGRAVLEVFVAAAGSGVVAALLTLSTRARYATDAATASAWGMTRLSDQQLAGAIMWVPGGFLYLGVAVALFAAWLDRRPSPALRLDPDRVTIQGR